MTRNYFYNLLLTLTNLLFPILSFPYSSRILGPEGIGKVQFVFSFSLYFGLIASLGIPVYGMKEIAKYRNDKDARSKVFSELIFIYVISTIILFIIYLFVILYFPYFTADRSMYIVASLMVLLGVSYIDWLYMGMEEFKSIALRSVLFKIIGLSLLYLFIRDRNDYPYYLYIMIFSYLGNNILSLLMINGKVKIKFRGLNCKKHMVPLFFILGTSLASSMYTDMDTVLLGFLSDSKTVGLYTAAVKLSKIAIPLVTSMGVILVPQIAMHFAEKNLPEVQKTLNQTFRFLTFFAVPIVFGLALLAPEFISLFSGKEFLPATDSMRILSLLPLIIGFGHLFLYLIMIPSGMNKQMFICVLGGVITSLILNVVLIPQFHAIGSSIASIISEIVVTLLYVYFIRKYYRFKYEWSLLFKALLSASFFIPIVWVARFASFPLIFTLIVSVSLCGLSYVTIQWFLFGNRFINDILDFLKLKFKIGYKG